MRSCSLYVLFLLLIWWNPSSASSIQSAEISVELRENGSFKVREAYICPAASSEAFLVRKIPTRFDRRVAMVPDSAFKILPEGGSYNVLLDSIFSNGRPLNAQKHTTWTEVRIPKFKHLDSGYVWFQLSYVVHGGVRVFDRTSEFYWPIIGTDLRDSIKELSFTVNLLDSRTLSKYNYAWYVGRPDVSEEFVELETTWGLVFGKNKQPLRPGMPFVLNLRFPKAYFDITPLPPRFNAQTYFVRELGMEVVITPAATLKVQERLKAGFVRPTRYIDRAIKDEVPYATTEIIGPTAENAVAKGIEVNVKQVSPNRLRLYPKDKEWFMPGDELDVLLTYQVNHGIRFTQLLSSRFLWPLLLDENDPEPYEKINFRAWLPKGYVPQDLQAVGIRSQQMLANYEIHEAGFFEATFEKVQGENLSFLLEGINPAFFNIPVVSYGAYFHRWTYDYCNFVYVLEPTGKIRGSQQFAVSSLSPPEKVTSLPIMLKHDKSSWQDARKLFPRDIVPEHAKRGTTHSVLVSSFKGGTLVTLEGGQMKAAEWPYEEINSYSWSYTQYGLHQNAEGTSKLTLLLKPITAAPISKGAIEVIIPPNVEPLSAKLVIQKSRTQREVFSLTCIDGQCSGAFPTQVEAAETAFLELEFPKNSFGQLSPKLAISLFKLNNPSLFWAGVVSLFGLLAVIGALMIRVRKRRKPVKAMAPVGPVASSTPNT
ncbi:MAG: DUF2207 domain-containing protein [Bacteroidota bacterium]